MRDVRDVLGRLPPRGVHPRGLRPGRRGCRLLRLARAALAYRREPFDQWDPGDARMSPTGTETSKAAVALDPVELARAWLIPGAHLDRIDAALRSHARHRDPQAVYAL